MANSSGGLTPQPPSFEKRLPIALALMMLVLLASQYFFKPAPGPKPVKPSATGAAATALATKPAPQVTPAAEVPNQSGPVPGQTSASSEGSSEIDTAVYHIVFTNRGGTVKSWIMKDFKENENKPLELVDAASSGKVPLPFAIEVKDQKLSFDPNAVLYQATPAPDGTGISFAYSDGHTAIHKSFTFTKNSYLAEVRSSVQIGSGSPVPHFLMWRGGFGDLRVRNAYSTSHTIRFDGSANKLVTKTAKDAKNGPVTDSGNYTFAGLEDTFFAAVALPKENAALEVRTFSDSLKGPSDEKEQPYVGTGLSTGAQNDVSLFVGPKDVDVLRAVNPKLVQLVDWGFFGVIAKPLFLWLNWTNDHWTGNYGWAIIIVTFIINLALFPLKLSSLKSARKMQRLQPQIQAINARFKNVKINDPKKAEQNQEVMALYKKEGVNPVGGCLPMVVQLPFFYAFYRVLSIAIELRHAPWMWVTDLSSAETLPIHLLPIILIVTQFLTQRMTPAAGVDPNQQKMMMFMPLMFGFMFYYASAGLVLYWLTGNLVGIVQQLIINRLMPSPAAAPAPVGKAPVKRTK